MRSALEGLFHKPKYRANLYDIFGSVYFIIPYPNLIVNYSFVWSDELN